MKTYTILLIFSDIRDRISPFRAIQIDDLNELP
jgi:hypothetical protein